MSTVTRRTRQRRHNSARPINRQTHISYNKIHWETSMLTDITQPVENVGYFTILEKMVWGSFKQLVDTNLNFEKLHQYHIDNYSKISDLGVIHHLYLHDIIRYNNKITKKGIHQKIKTIMNNPFISDDDKLRFFNIFSSCQKHYLALCKFAFICKFKRAKIGSDTDMYMNPIQKKGSNYVELLHENRKYIFTIPDLTKIIRKSLNSSSDMYADPQTIKNPYNNLSFTKSNLYTIYFAIKKSDYNIPTVFQQYFYSNFSLTRLIDDFEQSLRETAIREACITTDDEGICDLTDNILDMIEIYNDTHSEIPLNIHDDFPEEKLIEAFKPFIKHYYRSIYSLNNSEKSRSRIYWLASMKKFASENPSFGRKNIEIKTNLFGKKPHVGYNTNISSLISPYNYNYEESECHMKLTKKEKDFIISYRTNIKQAAAQREQQTTTYYIRPSNTGANNLNNENVNIDDIFSFSDSSLSSNDNGVIINLIEPPDIDENMAVYSADDEYNDDLERETDSIS